MRNVSTEEIMGIEKTVSELAEIWELVNARQ